VKNWMCGKEVAN